MGIYYVVPHILFFKMLAKKNINDKSKKTIGRENRNQNISIRDGDKTFTLQTASLHRKTS